jgi:uncharacterized protein
MLPLVAVGSLAIVILAGLVFWGLDAGRTRNSAREVVSGSHSTAETQASKVKGSAPPSPEKSKVEKPAAELPQPLAHAGVEKSPLPPTAAVRGNGPAEPAQVSKVALQENPVKDGRSDKPTSGTTTPVSTQDAGRGTVEKPLRPQGPPDQGSMPPEPPPASKVQSRENGARDVSVASEVREKLAYNVVPPPRPEPPTESLPPKIPLKPPVARVAIVIDDLGQDLDFASKLASIPLSLTFSVMPFQKHSQEVVAMARAHRHEAMLHMPMEPDGYPRVDPGGGALLASMSSQQIQQSLGTALDAVSPIGGINNHMGSRFTQNVEQMGIVMKELRERGLFFLDSATTANTKALDAAQRYGVPYIRRDIFLDHVLAESFVRAQLGQLIRLAKVQGRAVGIGHPHQVTLDVLRKESSLFEREGIAVVPAGQLLQRAPSRDGIR